MSSRAKLGTQEKRSIKDVLLQILCCVLSHDTANGFFLGCVFCPDVTDHCMFPGNADSPLFVCRDHSSPPLFGSKHGMGSWAFAGRMLTISGIWLTAQTALTFILHFSLQVFRRPVLMFTTHLLPAEVPMTCLQPTHMAVELANGYHGCSVARTVSSCHHIGGRAMELVYNHEHF